MIKKHDNIKTKSEAVRLFNNFFDVFYSKSSILPMQTSMWIWNPFGRQLEVLDKMRKFLTIFNVITNGRKPQPWVIGTAINSLRALYKAVIENLEVNFDGLFSSFWPIASTRTFLKITSQGLEQLWGITPTPALWRRIRILQPSEGLNVKIAFEKGAVKEESFEDEEVEVEDAGS